MNDLASRLSETLDELERVAQAATDGPWEFDGRSVDVLPTTRSDSYVARFKDCYVGDDVVPILPADGEHIARWDPQAVLRLVGAYRALMEIHKPSWADGEPHYSYHEEETTSGAVVDVRNTEPDPPYWCLTCEDFTPCPTIATLAAGVGITEEEG